MDEMFGHDMLTRAAATTTYPVTPQIRARVLQALAEPSRPRRTRLALAPLTVAVGVAVIVAIATTLAVTPSREAVADFFGIEGSEIEILPTPADASRPTPFPTATELDPGAVRMSLSAAADVAGFEPALLAGEQPQAAFTIKYGTETGIIVRYPEFDLWQVASGGFEGYFDKGVPSDVVVTDLTVAGVAGTWISGGPHLVVYRDSAGEPQGEPRAVERNTLIWRTETALYRLETLVALDEALEVAESLP